MEIIQKISAFVEKWHWAIISTLCVVCFMQQCTISSLQSQLNFVKEKYENPIPQQPLNCEEPTYTEETTEQPEQSDNTSLLIGMAVAIGALMGWTYYKSKWPFTAALSGKIWQDLRGKVIYTLTIKNRGKEAVSLNNAIIEFINVREKRTFKMPVPDFPLTLTKGTKHSANISLQRLMEQHQELTNYKMIRVGVECNGVVRHTMPLAVKWKR